MRDPLSASPSRVESNAGSSSIDWTFARKRSIASRFANIVTQVSAWAIAALVSLVFLFLVGDILSRGVQGLSWSFLTEATRDAGRQGGIGPILVSTGLLLAVACAVAVPLGLGTAVLLADVSAQQGRWSRVVRRSLDVLASVPSIVFGLFGSSLFCVYLGLGFSILSGGLTLACMVLPIFIRAAEESIRAVPTAYSQGAAALGLSRTATLFKLVLPTAAPGIAAGLVLGVGRAVAETAALIFTSGYVDRMPGSLLDSGRALSVHIFDLSMNVPGGDQNAYSSALVLVLVLFVVNTMLTLISRRSDRTHRCLF